ncbi:MAG: hypothetical protein M1831_004782 [Alyxoria varia]|nr:MAG: hypothetical protein M1831_004782 [Alyxoria varia]
MESQKSNPLDPADSSNAASSTQAGGDANSFTYPDPLGDSYGPGPYYFGNTRHSSDSLSDSVKSLEEAPNLGLPSYRPDGTATPTPAGMQSIDRRKLDSSNYMSEYNRLRMMFSLRPIPSIAPGSDLFTGFEDGDDANEGQDGADDANTNGVDGAVEDNSEVYDATVVVGRNFERPEDRRLATPERLLPKGKGALPTPSTAQGYHTAFETPEVQHVGLPSGSPVLPSPISQVSSGRSGGACRLAKLGSGDDAQGNLTSTNASKERTSIISAIRNHLRQDEEARSFKNAQVPLSAIEHVDLTAGPSFPKPPPTPKIATAKAAKQSEEGACIFLAKPPAIWPLKGSSNIKSAKRPGSKQKKERPTHQKPQLKNALDNATPTSSEDSQDPHGEYINGSTSSDRSTDEYELKRSHTKQFHTQRNRAPKVTQPAKQRKSHIAFAHRSGSGVKSGVGRDSRQLSKGKQVVLSARSDSVQKSQRGLNSQKSGSPSAVKSTKTVDAVNQKPRPLFVPPPAMPVSPPPGVSKKRARSRNSSPVNRSANLDSNKPENSKRKKPANAPAATPNPTSEREKINSFFYPSCLNNTKFTRPAPRPTFDTAVPSVEERAHVARNQKQKPNSKNHLQQS